MGRKVCRLGKQLLELINYEHKLVGAKIITTGCGVEEEGGGRETFNDIMLLLYGLEPNTNTGFLYLSHQFLRAARLLFI